MLNFTVSPSMLQTRPGKHKRESKAPKVLCTVIVQIAPWLQSSLLKTRLWDWLEEARLCRKWAFERKMNATSFHWGTIGWLCLGSADKGQLPHDHLGKPAKLTETLCPAISPQLFKLSLLFKMKQTGENAGVQQFHSGGPKLLQSPSPQIPLL